MKRWFVPTGLALGAVLCAAPALAGPYCNAMRSRQCGDCDTNVLWTVVNANVPRPAGIRGIAGGAFCVFRWGNVGTHAIHFDLVEPPTHGKLHTKNNALFFASRFNGSDTFVMKQTWIDHFSQPRTATVTYNITVVPDKM